MMKKIDQLLATMEPEDRAFVEPHIVYRTNGRGGYDSVSELIAKGTRQWQTLPGGFYKWREIYNKYSYYATKMYGIYEDDPWPSQSSMRITDEIRTPTKGAARFSA